MLCYCRNRFWLLSCTKLCIFFFFFFFKQKTAYEIVMWLSDVCSSDLPFHPKTEFITSNLPARIVFRALRQFNWRNFTHYKSSFFRHQFRFTLSFLVRWLPKSLPYLRVIYFWNWFSPTSNVLYNFWGNLLRIEFQSLNSIPFKIHYS